MSALLVLAAAGPSLLLLAYFYLRDRFDREPLGHLAIAYFLGMYAMVAAHGMATTAEGWFDPMWLRTGGEPARLVDALLLSGFIEEFAKWIVLLTAVYHWREFDEPLDGLIYGVTVSLGFATLENFLYLSRLGLDVAWGRAIFAVPAHALFGGAMGYYAGRAKFDHRRAISTRAPGAVVALWTDRALCLLVPIVFHGAYDFALAHGLGWRVWIAITALSLGLWIFVLRRVRRAQRASPYRPKTMPPGHLRPPPQ